MSTTNYNGFTLNDLNNTPWFSVERQLQVDICKQLAPDGQTFVTDQHTHGVITDQNSDILLSAESGHLIELPYIAPNSVLGTDSNSNIIATTMGSAFAHHVTVNTAPLAADSTGWKDSAFYQTPDSTAAYVDLGAGSGSHSTLTLINSTSNEYGAISTGVAGSDHASVVLNSTSDAVITLNVGATSTDPPYGMVIDRATGINMVADRPISIQGTNTGSIALYGASFVSITADEAQEVYLASGSFNTIYMAGSSGIVLTANSLGNINLTLAGGTAYLGADDVTIATSDSVTISCGSGVVDIHSNGVADLALGGNSATLKATNLTLIGGIDSTCIMNTAEIFMRQPAGGSGTDSTFLMDAGGGMYMQNDDIISLRGNNTGSVFLYGGSGITLQTGGNSITLTGLPSSSAGLTSGQLWKDSSNFIRII